jgi:hypothetical protein
MRNPPIIDWIARGIIYEKTLASARRMKTDGIEPALIAKYTGLSEAEIETL